MTADSRREQVLVLFASQTGNSEQAAMEVADQLPAKLSTPTLTVTSRHMQLDDFLELHQAEWTRLVVIVCSSYGVGQAPLGGYRFREFCDAILDRPKKTMLKGLSFALLGLGDSKYTTFFRNPTKTDQALQLAGATRVGDLGKADASADQLAIIAEWIDGIWPALQGALAEQPLSEERLEEMQRDTMTLCRSIDPEFMPEQIESTTSMSALLSILVVLLGIALFYYTSFSQTV